MFSRRTLTRKSWRSSFALRLSTLLALLGLTIVQPATVSVVAPQPTELRGVWLTNIDSEVLFSHDHLRQAVRRLKALHFNTLYPTIWNWGYTLYPSSIASQAIGTSQRLYPDLGNTGQPDPREVTQQDRDMLQELITLAHRQRLSVIPWFEFGFMAPAKSDLAHRHPDWLTQRHDGTSVVLEGSDPRVWLNPFHPEVQQFLVSLITEVVSRYDIDGIQLDDHFGLPVELGYDPFTVQLYRHEHQGSAPPVNPRDPDWMRWRADKITAVIAQIFQAVKAQKPTVVISLSPNPAEFAYETFLQDWVTWERRGYIEELVIQVYRWDRNRFLLELNRPEVRRARRHIPVSIGILAGLKQRPVATDWLVQQVKWARERRFAGVSFFFYETLWHAPPELPKDRLRDLQGLFRQPISRPSLTAFQRS